MHLVGADKDQLSRAGDMCPGVDFNLDRSARDLNDRDCVVGVRDEGVLIHAVKHDYIR